MYKLLRPLGSLAVFISLSLSAQAIADSASAPYAGKPYGNTPTSVPGIIPAQNYDVAPGNANGIAYNRNGTAKAGPERTTGDCIGLGTVGADHVGTKGEKQKVGDIYVGWTDVGDWWKYTIEVKEGGTYAFGGKFAAGLTGAQLRVTFTPLDKSNAEVTTGLLELPTTAGFQPGVEVYHVWETLDKLAEVKLSPGTYIMTVKLENQAGVNINYYSLSKK